MKAIQNNDKTKKKVQKNYEQKLMMRMNEVDTNYITEDEEHDDEHETDSGNEINNYELGTIDEEEITNKTDKIMREDNDPNIYIGENIGGTIEERNNLRPKRANVGAGVERLENYFGGRVIFCVKSTACN